ncbi:MAG: AbrB/MazE/SpoVT family DNA-binding domain-containing protein [Clostridiales bacterium]|jgi:AbrB family looped-hinge helix DNA binding protein|nr:AbrB/MazE/SpoVT family DNA-binding domain-containing protein [Clostridiales bacterium]
MSEVKISSKFQIVIPKGVRQQLNLKAGQKMQLITKGKLITLVPIYPFGTMRGTLKGMDISKLQ